MATLPVSMAGRQYTALRHDSGLDMVDPSLDVYEMWCVLERELPSSCRSAIPSEHQPTGSDVESFLAIRAVARQSKE